MKIILSEDVDKLGQKGDVIVVSDGYARNFLVPKGLAMIASKGALKQAEVMQRARAEKEAKARDEASARAEKLQAQPIYISARAGEDGRLFGSVTKSDVARGLADQLGEEIDRHSITLDDPIRTLGSHHVEVPLAAGVNATITVEVIAHAEGEEGTS
jgi:large subunit ribosomal protein L9